MYQWFERNFERARSDPNDGSESLKFVHVFPREQNSVREFGKAPTNLSGIAARTVKGTAESSILIVRHCGQSCV